MRISLLQDTQSRGSTLGNFCATFFRAIRKVGRIVNEMIGAIHHRRKLADYADLLPQLGESDAKIVQALHEEGVYVTSLETLGMEANLALLEAASRVVPTLAKTPGESGIDIHAKTSALVAQPDLYRWGLQERLLDIADCYLGLPAVFNDLHCRRDFVNGVKAGSRLWHVDSYDHRILRVFVYLSEVSETTGGFQYVSRQSKRWLIPILEQLGTVSEWLVDRLYSPNQIKTCTGGKGTVVFAATGAILHRGKLPTTGERLTLVFNYNTREVKKSEEAKPTVTSEELREIAKNCTPRQRRSLLWF
ncbi:MAG: hypothetical protein MUC48_16790 [Leptolyngbya sp. Prado105]|jgi:hypothetical protein|nr:hypothetical protein [Leptolyngbya sp. Prado105]